MVDDIDGLGGGEERDAGAVAEEAQVAVVGYYVDGGVPGDGGGGGGAGADVVDGADVDAGETEAGAVVEHAEVGGVLGREGEGEGYGGGGEGRGWRGKSESRAGELGKGEGSSVDGAGKAVVHRRKPEFWT